MSGRAFQRVPYAVRVEFRTASSFLVAYSVNLSRGGMFLETDHPLAIGTEIPLQLAVPGHGPIELTGRVMWRRVTAQTDGPAGIGIAFQDVGEALGEIIDRLVTEFKGLNVLLLVPRQQDQTALTRMIRAIMSTAEVSATADFAKGKSMLTREIDIAIVDADIYTDMAMDIVRTARAHTPPIPVIILATTEKLRAQARATGADEVTRPSPAFEELQKLMVRALGRPMRVRGEQR